MSGERVDLDELLELARAAQASADYREHLQRKGMARWIMSPRRDGTVDVVIEHDGADVFDRALEVDARFSVAAQPAVVVALVVRVKELEALASAALDGWRDSIGFTPTASIGLRAQLEKGVLT